MSETAFYIPVGITSKADVSRLLRELESLEENVRQSHLQKKPGSTKVNISQIMQEIAHVNSIDLRTTTARKTLAENLQQLKKSAPIVHISFASSPRAQFLANITGWFRREVHPHVLLEVGMQPGIAAGCVIRTTNKFFDFSLRKKMLDNTAVLAQKLREKMQ